MSDLVRLLLEARIGNLIAGIPVPYYLTPGNHDSDEVREALAAVPNVTVLAGSVVDIGGVRVLGVADPTFTADNRVGTAEATAEKRRQASVVGRLVAAQRPDVLALHDPVLAEAAADSVPLVVAGDGHERSNDEREGTRFLTVGSTGATGLGSFTVATQLDYEAEVLHFSGGRLVAVDYVSLGGLGGSFRIDRTVIQPTERPGPDPTTNGEPGAVDRRAARWNRGHWLSGPGNWTRRDVRAPRRPSPLRCKPVRKGPANEVRRPDLAVARVRHVPFAGMSGCCNRS